MAQVIPVVFALPTGVEARDVVHLSEKVRFWAHRYRGGRRSVARGGNREWSSTLGSDQATQSKSVWGGARAGAMGGASVGRLRWRRIFLITEGAVIKAIMTRSPPHLGQR